MALVTAFWLLLLAVVSSYEIVGVNANPCDVDPCRSSDHECVALSESDYQCVCVNNCGDLGDVEGELEPSACNPNPCERDCRCVESCKHAGGYYCRSDSGFLGKNCSIPAPTLRCEADKIVMSVSEGFLNEYDLGLKNSFITVSPTMHQTYGSSCTFSTPKNGVYEVIIPMPFENCNTTFTDTGKGMVFTNKMWFNRRVSNAMFDVPIPAAEFRCTYNREYKLLTSLKPVISTAPLITSERDILPTISLCKVAECPASCPDLFQVSRGAVYTVGEMIHVAMSLDSGDMATGIANMHLSCSADLLSSSRLDIVGGGCDARSGLPVFIRSSYDSHVVCVSFQTPHGLGCAEFFVHAELQSCDAANTEKCPRSESKRCLVTRGKRSAPSVVVIGPLVVVNGSSGQPVVNINGMEEFDVLQDRIGLLEFKRETVAPIPGVDIDTVMIVVLCATAALLLLILVPYIYVRSTRKQ